MMRVIRTPRTAGDRVIALGTFDGVHRGHRALIRAARRMAREMGVPLRVCTFDRHPLEVLRPDNPPELLSTTPEKALEMQRLGVDEMELIRVEQHTPEELEEMIRTEDFAQTDHLVMQRISPRIFLRLVFGHALRYIHIFAHVPTFLSRD